MKAILYSVCIGSLALALTAGGAQAATDKNKRQERAKPQQRSANVQAARPATASRQPMPEPATPLVTLDAAGPGSSRVAGLFDFGKAL